MLPQLVYRIVKIMLTVDFFTDNSLDVCYHTEYEKA